MQTVIDIKKQKTAIDIKKPLYNNPFHFEGKWEAGEESVVSLPSLPNQTNKWNFHSETKIARALLYKRSRWNNKERRVSEVIALLDSTNNTRNENQRAFESIKERLVAISKEEEEEDFTYKSSERALDLVSKLIKIGYLLSSGQIIKPLIAVDGQGGLKFDWRTPDKEVRLFIPARDTRTPYLYYREGTEDNIINNPDGKTLANWLTWLNE